MSIPPASPGLDGCGCAEQIRDWVARFELQAALAAHVETVLRAAPNDVRADLLCDPDFLLCEYEQTPSGTVVPVAAPRAPGQAHRGGRSVALRRGLGARSAAFAQWVVAHELAHAFLRNEGRWAGDDPELAADALAAEWGFPRPR